MTERTRPDHTSGFAQPVGKMEEKPKDLDRHEEKPAYTPEPFAKELNAPLMTMKQEYTVLSCETPEALCLAVTMHLSDGWYLLGGVSCAVERLGSNPERYTYCQALMRDVPTESEVREGEVNV